MADFKLRLSDDLSTRFDAWAASRGGRSAALRTLIAEACGAALSGTGPLPPRPAKLTVRLTAEDAGGLAREAAAMGLTPNGWAAGLIRHRLRNKPTFARPDELALIGMQGELRRIGVNVNQIARALNTAVMAGEVLNLELSYLDSLRAETRAHMAALRDAFAGNHAYWETAW